MKTTKIVVFLIIVFAIGIFSWSLFGKNDKVSETKLNEVFQIEVQRFEQLESTDLPITPDIADEIQEGRMLINNRMAVSEAKVSELTHINNTIEAALRVVDHSSQVQEEFTILTQELMELKDKDISNVSKENQQKAIDLIEKGEAIINNRMTVDASKTEQLRKVVDQLDKIFSV